MLYPIKINETFSDFPTVDDLAVIVYFQGCDHNCPNCQNKELQVCNKENAKSVKETYNLITDYCKRANTNKIVLSGGDPFYTENREETMFLISYLENENYEVCVYTGYELNDIETFYILDTHLHSCPTYLKCGRYIETLKEKEWGKTDEAFKLATTNQKFYKWINGKYQQISQSNVLHFN